MKEIGGYPELEQLISNEYYTGLTALNSARYALAYLIRARGIKKLYLPYWLCESVENICVREGCKTEFYSVDSSFMPCLDSDLEPDSWLYTVNYYGQLDNSVLLDLKNKYKNVIVDNVQAFYRAPAENTDTIYSCRKFFGVPDGAYLATDAVLEEKLPADISMGRMEHLLGRFEGDSASDYYDVFKKNDKSLYDSDIKYMSRLTHNLLGAIDYESARIAREKNFEVLSDAFDSINPLDIKPVKGPYAYPLYLKNGMKIKKQLAEKRIYIPTLWLNSRVNECESARDFAENILPLPCDRRYGKDDMITVINEVKKCIV